MRWRLLWMDFLENVISLYSLKTLSAIHLYKIKRQFIANTRSIWSKWSITTAISPINWTFQKTWNNLNFKGNSLLHSVVTQWCKKLLSCLLVQASDIKSVDDLDLETLPWEDKTGISSKSLLSKAFYITLALTTLQ